MACQFFRLPRDTRRHRLRTRMGKSAGQVPPPPVVEYVKANASNLEDVFLGPGVHFVQEDHPEAIGRALRDWVDRLPS